MQPAGGIDQEHVRSLGPGLLQGVEGEACGIGAGRSLDHGAAGALAPDLELLDRGRPEGVAGRQQHPLAAGRELLGELADRGGLAGAVDAADQDHLGPVRAVELQRPGDRLEDRRDRARERGAHLLVGDLLAEPGLCQLLDQLGGGLDPEVGADQGFFQLVEGLGIELPLLQDRGDVVAQPAGGAAEPRPQPLQPARARRLGCGLGRRLDCGRRRLVGRASEAPPPAILARLGHATGRPTRRSSSTRRATTATTTPEGGAGSENRNGANASVCPRPPASTRTRAGRPTSPRR